MPLDPSIAANIRSGFEEISREYAEARRSGNTPQMAELQELWNSLRDFEKEMSRQAREDADAEVVMDAIKKRFQAERATVGHVIDQRWLAMPGGLSSQVNRRQQDSLGKALQYLEEDGFIEVFQMMRMNAIRLTPSGYDRLYR